MKVKVKADYKRLKCGCTVFQYGPPIPCDKHSEENELRKVIREQAAERGHVLKPFEEYGSAGQDGKWTSFCEKCCSIVIMYDECPTWGDQINGPAILDADCKGSGSSVGL